MLGVLSLVSVVSILEYFGSLYSCYNLVLVIEFNLFPQCFLSYSHLSPRLRLCKCFYFPVCFLLSVVFW